MPTAPGKHSMDADYPNETDRRDLLRELRLALEVHGPALGSTSCGARGSSDDGDRRQQGGGADQGSSSADDAGPLSRVDASGTIDDAGCGNGADETSPSSSPNAHTRRREAAQSLCDALRTFVLGWDEQCRRASESGERNQSNGPSYYAAATEGHCAASEGEDPYHTLTGQVVSCLFGAFGPTDGQLRSILLQVLPELKANNIRARILSWLVRTIPAHSGGDAAVEMVYKVDESPRNDNNSYDDGRKEANCGMGKPVALDATNEVMSVLQTVIRSDPTFLVSVVDFFFSLLPSLSDRHANIVSRICVAGLKVVEAEELPHLIRCLFRSIRFVDGDNDDTTSDDMDEGEETDSEFGNASQHRENGEGTDFGHASGKSIGAIQAIRAVRTEWDLIQSYEDNSRDASELDANSGSNGSGNASVLVSIIGVLCESLFGPSPSGTRDPPTCVRKGYLSIVQDLLDRHDATTRPDSGLVLPDIDVVALIALSSSANVDREEVEAIIDEVYSMGSFPFGNSVIGLINSAVIGDAVSIRTKVALRHGLQNLCLCLLLCPLRCRRCSVDATLSREFAKQVEGFVSGALEALNSDSQGLSEFTSSLIDLSFIGSMVLKRQESSRSSFGVPKVKRSGRSRQAEQFLLQCAHRVENSSLKVLANLSANAVYRDIMGQYRQEFVEHLFDSPSSLSTADPSLIDLLCGVVASFFLNSAGAEIKDGEGSVSLIQRLLFVSPQTDSFLQHGPMNSERLDGEQEAMQRLGLCLCRHLVRSQVMTQAQCDTIWSWTMRIMRSQFSPTTNGRPSGEFPPALGLSGLLVLMEGCGIHSSASSRENTTMASSHDIPPRPSSDIYGMLKTIVARTGLIQLSTKVPALIQRSNANHACYYATLSSFFASSDENSANARRMTFSIACYMDSLFGSNISEANMLSVDDIASVPSAVTTFQWCYTLLDTYLQLGREASGGKWSPDGWLTASFILSRFSSGESNNNSTSSDHLVEITKALKHAHGCVAAMAMSAAVLKNAYGQYLALCLSGTEESQAKANALLRLIQYQLAVLYDLRRRCLSALSFIEKDTKSLRGNNASKRGKTKKNMPKAGQKKRERGRSDQLRKKRKKKKPKSGGDRLLGNYDASRRIRYLESLNNTEKANGGDGATKGGADEKMSQDEDGGHFLDSSRDVGSEESTNDMDIWLSSQCQSIRNFLSDQLSKPHFITQELLCDCLLCDDDGATLGKFVDSLIEQDDTESFDQNSLYEFEKNSLQIIWLRRAISAHLAVLIKESSVKLSPRSLPSFLHTIEELSPILKILRSNGHRRWDDPDPSSILPVLIPDDEQQDDVYAFDIRTLLSSHYDVLAASIQTDWCAFAQGEGHTDSTSGSIFNFTAHSLYQRLDSLLSTCEDGVLACQIVDLVALVVIHNQNSTMDGIELSWKALTTVYAGCSVSEVMLPEVSGRLLCRPPAFRRVIQRFTQNSGATRDVRGALDALDRFASTSTRHMKENALLRYSLLNHWALIMTKSCGSPYGELRKLVRSLRFYVEDISQDIRGSSSMSFHRARRVTSNARAKGKKGKALHPVDSPTDLDMPNLTAKSFPVFYEGLLYGIIASFALVKPGRSTGNGSSPFKDIQLLSLLFRDMAEMFSENCKLFPQRTMGVVVRACAMVVLTCERQVIDSVTWRNKQPFLQRSDGDTDFASSAFLQTLIDNMAFNCAGSAILFGDLIKSQAKQGRPTAKDSSSNASDDDLHSDDTDDEIGVKGEDWAYGSYQKAVANLLLQGEKVIDALRGVCTSYNLRHPRIRMTKSEMREVASRDRLLAKMRDEEKKEASSSEERPGSGQEATRPAKSFPAASVRHRSKRKVAVENVSTSHAEKKAKRRITPVLLPIRSQESEQKSNAELKNLEGEGNVEQGRSTFARGGQEETSKEVDSDSEESLQSNDSFGIDGGWG